MGYICMIKYPILLQVIYTCNCGLLPLISAWSDVRQDAIHSRRQTQMSVLVKSQILIAYYMVNFPPDEEADTSWSLYEQEKGPIKLTGRE